MRLSTNLAATTLVALLLATGPSVALDFGIKDRTPIDVKDHKDRTPLDIISDPTPINIANPKAGTERRGACRRARPRSCTPHWSRV